MHARILPEKSVRCILSILAVERKQYLIILLLALQHDPPSGFHAAAARTLSRSLALYFSRPVRLFRPAKGTVF